MCDVPIGEEVVSGSASSRSGRWGVSIGNVAKLEDLAIVDSESDGSLGFYGTIGAWTVSGSGGLDAITSFGVGAVFSSGAGVHTVVLEDGDFIGTSAVCGRGGVTWVEGGGSHGQKAGEDDLWKEYYR